MCTYVDSLGPARYVGVDIRIGPRVDEVVDASDLVQRIGSASFDAVFTTEMLEHVRDWRTVVSNLKRVLRPGGVLLSPCPPCAECSCTGSTPWDPLSPPERSSLCAAGQ